MTGWVEGTGPGRPRTGVPACWSWPAVRPIEADVTRRFWDGMDTAGYSEKAMELLQEAADALDTDSQALTTWQAAGRYPLPGSAHRPGRGARLAQG